MRTADLSVAAISIFVAAVKMLFECRLRNPVKGVSHVRVPRTSHSYGSLIREHVTRSRGKTIESGELRK